MSSIWRWCVAFDNEELKYLTQSFLIDYENVTCREREGEKIERWEMKLKNFSYYRKRLDKTNFFGVIESLPIVLCYFLSRIHYYEIFG